MSEADVVNLVHAVNVVAGLGAFGALVGWLGLRRKDENETRSEALVSVRAREHKRR